MAILSIKLPKDIVRRIFEFAYGVPTENKKRLIAEINTYKENYIKDAQSEGWRHVDVDNRQFYQVFYNVFVKNSNCFQDGRYMYNSLYYIKKEYTRTDDPVPFEFYYLDDLPVEDYPRNQLSMYKRYVRQLEQKIKNLEEQLQKQKS